MLSVIFRRQMHPRIVVLFTICLAAWCCPETAWADNQLEDVLSGFDDTVETVQPDDAGAGDELGEVLSGFDELRDSEIVEGKKSSAILPEWFDLFGSISVMGTWNFSHDAPAVGEADFRGLSMLRTTGTLGVDIDRGDWQARITGHGFYDAVYSIQGRDQYTGDMLDEYEQELEFDEFYLEGGLTNSLDVTVGRQVVVWGKADNLRVTDILNPLDNRIPGLVDIKYKRLPVTMSKFDYYTGPWNLSGIVVNEVRFDKNPVYNSDFYPGDTPAVAEKTPAGFDLDNQQYGLAVNGIFSGWDLSFYQAWVYDNRARLSQKNSTAVRVHDRVSMSGVTGNIAFGNWLFKGEGAWWHDLEYGAVPDRAFDRVDIMAGIEYTGFSETMLSLEFVNRHIVDFDQQIESSPDFAEQDLQQTAFVVSRDFANDSTQLKLLCSVFGIDGEGGAFERLQLEHDFNDQVTLIGGVILYQSGDLPAFSELEGNDRIFLEYVYSF